MSSLTHFDEHGNAVMVDVGDKAETDRTATAGATIRMAEATLARIAAQGFRKGDVLAVAQLAGIMGAKRTADLIPLCHPLPLDKVEVALVVDTAASAIHVRATCRVKARTGVEMEALTAVAIAALTVYDMCKSIDRGMVVTDLRLLAKAGGRSGTFEASA